MKKILSSALFFLFIIFSSCFQLNAQEKRNQIKTSLVMPLARVFDLSYERMLNEELSIQLGVGIGDFVYFNPQFRYYLSENHIAPTGVFVSPYALISEDPVGGGVLIGYQRLYKGKVSLEAYLGPLVADQVTVWGGINIGFAF